MTTPKVATKKFKKGRPVDTSLQVAGKQSKKSNICPLCNEPIIESGEHIKGQDAVYCEGQCKTWLHRKCAALPKSMFDQIGESDELWSSSCRTCSVCVWSHCLNSTVQ